MRPTCDQVLPIQEALDPVSLSFPVDTIRVLFNHCETRGCRSEKGTHGKWQYESASFKSDKSSCYMYDIERPHNSLAANRKFVFRLFTARVQQFSAIKTIDASAKLS